MKSVVVLAMLVAVAVAGPVSSDPKTATILRLENDNIGVEGYKYGYETSDGKSAQEEGTLQNAGTDNEALYVRGQFSYTAPDGQLITVTYEAGPEGYKAEGSHIPKAL